MSGIKEDITMGGYGSHGYGAGYGGDGYGGSGIWVFAILIVFVILALAFRRNDNDHNGHFGHFGGFPGFGGCGCPPVCKPVEDVAVAGIAKEIAILNGQAIANNEKQTGILVHAIDQQTCQMLLGEKDIMQQAAQIAADQAIGMRDMKIADLRDKVIALENFALHEKTMNAIGAQGAATNAHISSIDCQLNHRLDRIECEVPKRPPTWAASVTPHTFPLGFPGFGFDRDRDRNCGCCG